MSEKCVWNQDDLDSELWHSDCKHDFIFNDEPPDFNFCPYCGKNILLEKFEEA